MTDYSKTATLKNLQIAIAGEFLGHLQYLRNAAVAREEGHDEIARTFETLAENELQHALLWGNELLHTGDTAANLRRAIASETQGGDSMYPEFAATAAREGFGETERLLHRVADIESRHADIFRELLHELDGTPLPEKKKAMPEAGRRFAVCKFCGAVEVARPDATCSLCKHPDAF